MATPKVHEVKSTEEVLLRDESVKKLKMMRDKDRQMVKGIFKYYEVPGGSVSFSFKKYKGDAMMRYDMVDGSVHTIPLAVAKHLNSNTWYPIHGYTTDEAGKPLQSVSQKVNRMAFQSLEFMDIDDYSTGKEIISVNSMLSA